MQPASPLPPSLMDTLDTFYFTLFCCFCIVIVIFVIFDWLVGCWMGLALVWYLSDWPSSKGKLAVLKEESHLNLICSKSSLNCFWTYRGGSQTGSGRTSFNSRQDPTLLIRKIVTTQNSSFFFKIEFWSYYLWNQAHHGNKPRLPAGEVLKY